MYTAWPSLVSAVVALLVAWVRLLICRVCLLRLLSASVASRFVSCIRDSPGSWMGVGLIFSMRRWRVRQHRLNIVGIVIDGMFVCRVVVAAFVFLRRTMLVSCGNSVLRGVGSTA